MRTYDAQELKFQLPPNELKPLFKTSPYIHVANLLLDWLVIFGSIAACVRFPSGWLYVLTVFTIGARMHAMAVLMHDATHYRFLKNRKWNDLISNYLTMYLLFFSIESYRKNHLAHHQNLNTETDPDWVVKIGKRGFSFPKSKTEFILTLASYLLLYKGVADAFWFLKRFGHKAEKGHTKTGERNLKLFFYFLLFGGLTVFGGWKYFLLFWLVPYFSTFFMFQYIRSVAEHFGGMHYDNLLTSTRTVRPTLLERFLISPHNINYHLEHHLYPGVPFYHLPKLHKLLMQQADYLEKAHITDGYTVGLLREIGERK